MKKILILLILTFTLGQIYAQSNIQLNIHHKLGEEEFEFEKHCLNNLKEDMMLERVEYYISEITLIHDGGMEIQVEDLWLLVNAEEETTVDLGEYDITELEKLRFYVGVNEEHNHLDPSQYPSSHPLAPQWPSMHWGWASGYRFVAIEGKGGENLNQTIQLHGLGDQNYFANELELNIGSVDGQINIHIDADYSRALENIPVSSGVFVHGDYGEAQRSIENFRDHVFRVSDQVSTINSLVVEEDLIIYPNPSDEAIVRIKRTNKQINEGSLVIHDMLGRQVHYGKCKKTTNGWILENLNPGSYFIALKNGIEISGSQILIVN